MERISLEIKGTLQTIKLFKSFGREGDIMFKQITEIAGLETEAEAKRLAKVDTGKMRQGIRAEKLSPLRWLVIAHEIYSVWQEFGTSNPNYTFKPFLHPAWKKVSKTYRRNLRVALNRLAKKYNK